QSVFLPADGYRGGTYGELYSVGNGGYYWSASPNGSYAYYLSFFSGNAFPDNYAARKYALSVRLVREIH
ncbi:MAG: fibrobacter succinogenes major paralogous domain-containing protein, partial [Prevotella sp.]|nr:fibrobacter succinogenes major paralogous domain-containing protein [Prevotella sp.]